MDDFLGLGDESKEEEPKGNAADDLADLDFGMGEEQPKEEEEEEKPVVKKPVAKKPAAKKVVKKVVKKAAPKKEEPVDEVDDFLGLGDESKEEEPKGNAAD